MQLTLPPTKKIKKITTSAPSSVQSGAGSAYYSLSINKIKTIQSMVVAPLWVTLLYLVLNIWFTFFILRVI